MKQYQPWIGLANLNVTVAVSDHLERKQNRTWYFFFHRLKVKKHKYHNHFIGLTCIIVFTFIYLLQDATDDERLKADEESASKDEKNEEEGKGKKQVLT